MSREGNLAVLLRLRLSSTLYTGLQGAPFGVGVTFPTLSIMKYSACFLFSQTILPFHHSPLASPLLDLVGAEAPSGAYLPKDVPN